MSSESISKFAKVFKILVLITASLLIIYSIWLSIQIEAISTSQFNVLQLAEELRHSSRDLTTAARAYVVTRDSRYFDDYQKILAVRDGKMARPDGRVVPLHTLISLAGVTSEEFELLNRSKVSSDRLSKVELAAMNLMKSKKETRDAAIEMLYSLSYQQSVQQIQSPIVDLEKSVGLRTKQEIANSGFALRTILIFVICLMGLGQISGLVFKS